MAVENPIFNNEESQQISEAVEELTAAGEEAIAQVEWYRIQILTNAKNLIFQPSPSPLAIEIARSLKHEAEVMGEVLRRVNTARQFQGLDDMSELDRHAQTLGLGSVFDENSEISQRIKTGLSR